MTTTLDLPFQLGQPQQAGVSRCAAVSAARSRLRLRLAGRGAGRRAGDQRGGRGRRRGRVRGAKPARPRRAALRRRGAGRRQAEPDPERVGAAGRGLHGAHPRLVRRARPLVVAGSAVPVGRARGRPRSCGGERPPRFAPTRSPAAPLSAASGRPSTTSWRVLGVALADGRQQRRLRRPRRRHRAAVGALRAGAGPVRRGRLGGRPRLVPGCGLPAGGVRAVYPKAGGRLRLRRDRAPGRRSARTQVLATLAGCLAGAAPSVALGEDVRIEGKGAIASGLVWTASWCSSRPTARSENDARRRADAPGSATEVHAVNAPARPSARTGPRSWTRGRSAVGTCRPAPGRAQATGQHGQRAAGGVSVLVAAPVSEHVR